VLLDAGRQSEVPRCLGVSEFSGAPWSARGARVKFAECKWSSRGQNPQRTKPTHANRRFVVLCELRTKPTSLGDSCCEQLSLSKDPGFLRDSRRKTHAVGRFALLEVMAVITIRSISGDSRARVSLRSGRRAQHFKLNGCGMAEDVPATCVARGATERPSTLLARAPRSLLRSGSDRAAQLIKARQPQHLTGCGMGEGGRGGGGRILGHLRYVLLRNIRVVRCHRNCLHHRNCLRGPRLLQEAHARQAHARQKPAQQSGRRPRAQMTAHG